MNWLTRMIIPARLAQIEKILDNYDWHKRLWECFPYEAKAKRDFLTRIEYQENHIILWIASLRQTLCPPWCPPESFEVKEIAPSFFTHTRYSFDLLANPTKKLPVRGPDGKSLRQSKRVALTKEEDLRAWLERKGQERCLDAQGNPVPGGFCLSPHHPLEISPMIEEYFSKPGHKGVHGGVRFRGILEVTDPQSFIDTYTHGLGSAKSFGFGLLLLAPLTTYQAY